MAFDFKKEYREFYLPKAQPEIVDVPAMNFVAVRGQGDPNQEGGAYQQAIGILYAIAFTLKMSARAGHVIEGFYDYVVPPLEGFWWMQDGADIDYRRKQDFEWISVIRLPDFIRRMDFDWAVAEAAKKKKQDVSKAEFYSCVEGACVQCMHIGPYDKESDTIRLMEAFAGDKGYAIDITPRRHHHEIYLSDARRCAPERLKTVIRLPVRPLKPCPGN
nr:GyrI-like domain-containing protein [bacterium]